MKFDPPHHTDTQPRDPYDAETHVFETAIRRGLCRAPRLESVTVDAETFRQMQKRLGAPDPFVIRTAAGPVTVRKEQNL